MRGYIWKSIKQPYTKGRLWGVFWTAPLVNQIGSPDPNIQLLIFRTLELIRWPLVHFGGVRENVAPPTPPPFHLQVMYEPLEGENYLQSSTGQNPRTIGSKPDSPVFAAISSVVPSSPLTRERTLTCWWMRCTMHPSTDLLPLISVQRPISQKSYL
jgi:hypothetical protein